MTKIMKIIINNIATEYKDEGSGPTMLLLHGWWDSLKTFDKFVPFLKDEHRIVRLDLPGFGNTETPPKDWNLDDYVNFVKAFIKKLNISVDILVGHSMGGRIAIKGRATSKLSANKIILIASAGNVCRQTARNFLFKILAKICKFISPNFLSDYWELKLRRPFYKKLGSDYAEAGALKNTLVNIIEEDLTSAANKIAVPTLLIWGEDDVATPLSDGQRFAESIKGSVLKIIKGAGHFVHQEKPEQVAELVKEFL